VLGPVISSSCLVPVYNRSRELRRLLGALAGQTFPRDVFSAHSARYVGTEQDQRQREHSATTVRTTAKVGKLGLRRTGTNLQYLVVDGEAAIPAEIRSAAFTDADVSSVRISLHRGGADTAGDVRWKEVVMRADEFIEPQGRRTRGWVLPLGALLAAVVLGIGVWRYRRGRM
jgi:hypothetical protein